MNPNTTLPGAIAVTRFGLGARPGEIAAVSRDPRGWLLAQLEPAAAPSFPGVAGSAERLAAVGRAIHLDPEQAAGVALKSSLASEELFTRAKLAATTPNGFRERWTLFWANHFALQEAGGYSEMLSGAFVREAIEPHQFGRFEDLLVAASQHPAMLIALNQNDSVGPDSVAGRSERRGINENLAREVMELHALGQGDGYDQADVRELALGLAGYRVGHEGEPVEGRFVVEAAWRQPGERRLLGRTFPFAPDQGEAMLRHIARQPAVGRWIGYKLARHFVADRPDPALVARLETALNASGGSLAAVARALVEAPEAWAPLQRKFKTPYEHLISVYRAVDGAPDNAGAVQGFCGACGHSPLWSPSARGASDEAQAWATSLALAQRADLGHGLVGKSRARTPIELADSALGPLLSPASRRALAKSADGEREQTLTLALMTPEFLRR